MTDRTGKPGMTGLTGMTGSPRATDPLNGARRRAGTGWIMLCVACAGLQAVADDRGQPQAAAPAETPALATREAELVRQYRELERAFLRLADLLEASDPRRAALLRRVCIEARDGQLSDRLDGVVRQLEQGQLLQAGATQQGLIEQLQALHALLASGDDDRRLAQTNRQVREFLARLAKSIARQRDIEAGTEGGIDAEALAARQQALADETQALARDLGDFADRSTGSQQSADGREQPKPPGDGSRERENPSDQDPQQDPKREPSKPPEGPRPGAGEGEPRDAAPSDPQGERPGQEGSPGGEGKPVDGASPAGGEQQEGQPGGGDEAMPQGDDDGSRAQRTAKRLEAAERRMRQARERLESANRGAAREEQQRAIEELEQARAELQEILRQVREEEVERLLVRIEARVRDMLRIQREVLSSTRRLAEDPRPAADRARQLESARIGREQATVSEAAARALTLVRDDGSAVAVPQALEQVRDDADQSAARLSRGDVGSATVAIEEDIVAGLEELLAALERARRDPEAAQQSGAGGRPPAPGDQPLVDALAELKMLRSLQLRVNTRTSRFARLLGEGVEEAAEPELRAALARLATRQQAIEEAAHDIVTGRVE